jgi:hypothetical protein
VQFFYICALDGSAADSFHATPSAYGDAVAHLNNTTLQQIDQLVQDVEMQVAIVLSDHSGSAN